MKLNKQIGIKSKQVPIRLLQPTLGNFTFRLYVAGSTQNSTLARANLTAFCATHLPNQHAIEIVDVLRHPARAVADGVFMTPTLIKLTPAPRRKIIGTLSETPLLLETMELEILPA